MEAKELRLDNLVSQNGIVCSVVAIHEDEGVSVLGKDFYHTVNEDDLQPIPLTEEWLLKFGFNEKDTFENDKFKLSVMYYDGWHLNYEEKEEFGNAEASLYPANIWSVHDLQNLFYSLTNEELCLKD